MTMTTTVSATTSNTTAPSLPKRSLSGMFQMRGVQRTVSSQSTVSLGGGEEYDLRSDAADLDDALWLRLEGGLFGSNNMAEERKGRNWFSRTSNGDTSPTTVTDADQFLWGGDSNVPSNHATSRNATTQ